jgi:glycine/D-amino acid oxidase-like deaminating enzyme/nitrite reductase/ring-hydroxylating ferredoxin subunit
MTNIKGRHESLWMATTPATHFNALGEDIAIDVAVVGGGLAGLSTALRLIESGAKVAVIEARRVGTGVSGYTTAKITSLHRRIYHHLIKHFGLEKAQLYAGANEQAIGVIADICRRYRLDCDFETKPAYTFAETDEHLRYIEEEIKAGQSAGLKMSFAKDIGLPLKIKGAAMLPGQAQFHPRKYMLGLAKAITEGKGSVYENTRVVKIDCEGPGPYSLKTAGGNSVRAKDIFIATNYPIHDKDGLYFSRLQASNSYAVGIRIKGKFPDGMYLNSEDEGHSFRQHPAPGGEIVLVLDGSHPVGQGGDVLARYRGLSDFTRSVFDVTSQDYWWTAQDAISIDKVPYIGNLTEGHHHLFVATGFRKWGMAHSTVAAQLITDLIAGRENPWKDLYNPYRFKPLATAGEFVPQALKTVGKLAEKELPAANIDLSEMKNGDSAVGSLHGEKAAVYKDDTGKLHTLDRTCTHMGCMVNWNNAELSWDCPCHGSRYDFEGHVIHSPTVTDLKKINETESRR